MNKAVYYNKLKEKTVQCTLCPFNCVIKKGMTGQCKTRINYEGTLYSLAYGNPTGFAIDPIEKKPFYHYNPGARVLSFGTLGCNLKCEYCCNYYYSQKKPETATTIQVTPEEIVNKALKDKCDGIAYTYNEPTIFLEYAMDTARLARKKGLFNIFVTNGIINKQPLTDMDPYLDAAVINFKGFNTEFYKEHIHAKLEWVKQGIEYYSGIDCHKEVTNLIIPGHIDDADEIKKFSQFIINTLGPETPVHFLRFNPTYKMSNLPQTPIKTLEKCHDIARKEGLSYVYLGNTDSDKENTYCPECNELLIKRQFMQTIQSRLNNKTCPACGAEINVKGSIRANNNTLPD